ncbi:MAG: S9 family peptidase [Bacteroidales bacterium]|nr:S9 family peptidase [Bacteroidales bacterium]
MKLRTLSSIALAAMLLAACNGGPQRTSTKADDIIGPQKVDASSGILTPEVLWAFGRLGESAVSPNGKRIAYTVTWYSKEQNRGNSELFVMNIDGSDKRQLTHTAGHEFNPQWVDDQTIAYLSTESGTAAIWIIGIDGTNARPLDGFGSDISGFKLSPNRQKVLLAAETKVGKEVTDIHTDLPKTTGMVFNDLMYRHWDTFEDSTFSHIYVADFSPQKGLSNAADIMPSQPYDAPLKPFGGMEEVDWSADGTKVAYTCKKMVGKRYAYSTDSDIYLYDLQTGETQNLTQGMPGYDKAPCFSPDGRHMAWLSMERAGFEADRERLFLLDLQSGEKRDLTKNFDNSAGNLLWMPDGSGLYFIAGVQATFQIYRMALTDEQPTPITKGWHDYHSIALADGGMVGSKVSITKPAELYRIDMESGTETEISFINKELLDQLTMPEVTERWVRSTDGQMVHTWVILPPHFDKNKQYPALLFCEGGPQSPVSQFWSYRWNFSIMASNGYVVVAPARRGSTTFGQKWVDAISKDHGGMEMHDLLSAIDEVKQEPWVDENRLGAIGASYGGYTVFWLAGNHNKRFKAFIAHCGIFHAEMEYLTTEEMFFDEWEMGGAPWDTDNKVAQRSFSHSPHKYIKNWDTPILVIHGNRDYRVPYSQGMAAFNAAQIRGIPSKLLLFPDETHWVLKPQNGILWQREFKSWLDQWLMK